MNDIWFALWFFLPAGVANAMPVFANKIPLVNKWGPPMDFSRNFKGKRILGPNKTWRGFFGGVIGGAVTSLATYIIYPGAPGVIFGENVAYPIVAMAALGALLGAGALLGDATESFFKRQVGVPSGSSWFPFDQTDYIIGGLLLVSPFVNFALITYLVILCTWFVMHIGSAYIGYLLKLKDKPI